MGIVAVRWFTWDCRSPSLPSWRRGQSLETRRKGLAKWFVCSGYFVILRRGASSQTLRRVHGLVVGFFSYAFLGARISHEDLSRPINIRATFIRFLSQTHCSENGQVPTVSTDTVSYSIPVNSQPCPCPEPISFPAPAATADAAHRTTAEGGGGSGVGAARCRHDPCWTW